MSKMTRRALAGATLIAALAVSSAFAQQPQTQRVRGPIEAVDGSTLTVKAGEAGGGTVTAADNAAAYVVVKATPAAVKPGAFIGVGAMLQADGSPRAVRVMVLADQQRG